MDLIPAIVAIISRFASSFNAVNKEIFDGKLSVWLAAKSKTALTHIPTWVKNLKAMHSRHFYLMRKYNRKNKRLDRLTNKLSVGMYVYLSANMYLISFIFFFILAGSISKLSLAKLLMGLATCAFYFWIGQYYRADAYNKAVKSKVNLVPWKRTKLL